MSKSNDTSFFLLLTDVERQELLREARSIIHEIVSSDVDEDFTPQEIRRVLSMGIIITRLGE